MITVASNGLRAESDVYLPTPQPLDFARRLSETAEQWRGWDGDKSWSSIEGTLTVVWSHDRLGHVTFRATLQPTRQWFDWSAVATVEVDAGHLDRLAIDVKRFCSSRPAS